MYMYTNLYQPKLANDYIPTKQKRRPTGACPQRGLKEENTLMCQ